MLKKSRVMMIVRQIFMENYLNDIVKIFVHGSTVDDIDTFLSQLHNDIKYEHKEYGADFTKLIWRKAFIRQREKGFYQEQRRMQGKILNIIYIFRIETVLFNFYSLLYLFVGSILEYIYDRWAQL